MKVSAALLTAPNEPFRIEQLDLADPRGGEVLVRVRAVGVCHSDWHLATGATKHPMPVVPGHEGAGVVEAVGPGVTDVNVRSEERRVGKEGRSRWGAYHC